jgi:ribosomal 30S subunit maturation factor RimM
VLVVRTADERQVLIPTAREIMLEIDQPGRRIVVDAIPGLLDE